jgi:transposase
MFIVGIDIAKRSHEAIVIDRSGNSITKSFSFTNDSKGFSKLTDTLIAIDSDLSHFEFGMEATGHYWLNLYAKLVELPCAVHVINPVQSDALRGLYIRQTKTDSKDSFLIAELIRFGRYTETALAEPDLIALRDLTRQRFYIVDLISDAKRKVITLLDKAFPEYAQLFTDTFGSTSLSLLEEYPTPDLLAEVPTDKLIAFLKSVSHGRFGAAKAEQLKSAAKDSFGSFLFADTSAFAIRQFLEQIRLLESQLDNLNSFIADYLSKFDTKLTTIIGVGPTLAAVFVAEIGDINRFSSAEKLAAFAGIDPTVKQSGQFTGTKAHMSKRGSPYLRRALYLAAVAANLHNPALHAIYEKKRSQGKPHGIALSTISRKLLNIIFAVMKSGNPYQIVMPDYALIT